MAVTESMGSIYDRSREHLGTTDSAVIRMRRMLVSAAKNVAQGIDPPGVEPDMPYADIRSAERIITKDEDWRLLGTSVDPYVKERIEGITAG